MPALSRTRAASNALAAAAGAIRRASSVDTVRPQPRQHTAVLLEVEPGKLRKSL